MIATEGGYRMRFLATPHEVGRGEQPDFELHVTDSAAGIDWQPSRRFTTADEGFFDNAIYPTAADWCSSPAPTMQAPGGRARGSGWLARGAR